jgi:phosphoglycerate dehydrogenase-like enzyme
LLNATPTGALLINVSRGAVVNEQALTQALKVGRLTAALDVFEDEPLPPSSELWNCPGLLITPHNAGYAANYLDGVLELFVGAANAVKQGLPPATLVDRKREY